MVQQPAGIRHQGLSIRTESVRRPGTCRALSASRNDWRLWSIHGREGPPAGGVVELLGGIFSWAEKRDLVPGPNPVHGVETARGEAKDRVLSADELQALGNSLDPNAATMPMARAALKLIALTGLRREEACG